MQRALLSLLRGGFRIGSDFFQRVGATRTQALAPKGLVDHASDLGVVDVHPAMARFLERTSELDLHVRSRWAAWFYPLWRFVLRPIFAAMGQLFLPLREGNVHTRVLALDPLADGRDGARGIVREYIDSGRTMQVIAYATCRIEGESYLGAALPLPGGNLAGLLRLDTTDTTRAATLTTRALAGGIWYATRWFAMPLPLREQIAFWVPGMAGVPPELDPRAVDGCTLLARHEQHLFGLRVVTHDYWFYPALR